MSMSSRVVWSLVSTILLSFGCTQQSDRVGSAASEESKRAEVAAPEAVSPEIAAPEIASPEAASSKEDASGVPSGDAEDPPEELVGVSPACAAKYAELRTLRSRIPLVFAGNTRSHDEIDADVKKAAALAESFLAECGNNAATVWVRSWLARDRFTRISRISQEIQNRIREENGLAPGQRAPAAQQALIDEQSKAEVGVYFDRTQKLAQEALAASRRSSETHCNALGLLADIAFHHQYDFPGYREYAMDFVESCEVLDGGQDHYFNIGLSYVYEGSWDAAIAWMRKVIAQRSDKQALVTYKDVLWQALWAAGDPGGVEEVLLELQNECDEWRKRDDLLSLYRAQWDQWHYTTDFYVGLARYALGDTDGAVERFRRFNDRVNALEVALKSQGKELPSVHRIIRDFRSLDMAEFIAGPSHREPGELEFADGFQGKTPKVDMEGTIEWVSGRPTSIASSKGKVLAVLFRQPENARSKHFLLELERLKKTYPATFDAVHLSFLPNALSEAGKSQRFASMAAESASLELTISGGYDVSEKNRFFNACHATMGSPSFVLLDAEGKIAWYHVDPTIRDVNILAMAVERLMQSAGEARE